MAARLTLEDVTGLSTAQMHVNLLNVYDAATADQIEEGVGWYRAMRSICQSIADEHGLPLVNVVGAMAALSPQQPVGRNISLTRTLVHNRLNGRGSGGHYGAAIRKAEALVDGAPLSLLGNRKTACFARNILFGGAGNRVTIDRHAYRALTGDGWRAANGGTSHDDAKFKTIIDNDFRYGLAEDVYRKAAQTVRRNPPNFQAIVWVVTRNGAW